MKFQILKLAQLSKSLNTTCAQPSLPLYSFEKKLKNTQYDT